jgi:hypothetical protein
MEINVYGTASKKLKTELSEAAEFFARCLMHRRMVDNLELDIEIENKLDVQGMCINEDDTSRSRFFTVQLRKDTIDDMIQTLAHEMIHVKQYAKNEHVKKHLTTKGGLKIQSYWLGELWKPIKDEVDYYDSPWEIEAYGREVGLMHRWIRHKEKA